MEKDTFWEDWYVQRLRKRLAETLMKWGEVLDPRLADHRKVSIADFLKSAPRNQPFAGKPPPPLTERQIDDALRQVGL